MFWDLTTIVTIWHELPIYGVPENAVFETVSLKIESSGGRDYDDNEEDNDDDDDDEDGEEDNDDVDEDNYDIKVVDLTWR